MSEQIRVNYPALQEMARHCDMVAERLRQTAQLGRKIAGEMTNGGLVGDTGEAFSAALNGPFSSSVLKLSQKFNEVSRDIRGAIADMQAADRDASSNF
jgi:WXG100 family type VII secretion target